MFKATELQVCVSRLMMPAVCWPRGCGSLSPWSKHCCHLAGQASELCSGNQLSALSHFYALQPAKAIGNLLQVLKKMPEFTTSNISANSWAQSSGWRWVMMWWHLGMPTCNAQRRICLDTDFCPQLYTWRVRLLDECTAVAKYIWPIKPVTASSLHSCSCLQRSECFHQFINAATPPKRCREHCSTEYSSVAHTNITPNTRKLAVASTWIKSACKLVCYEVSRYRLYWNLPGNWRIGWNNLFEHYVFCWPCWGRCLGRTKHSVIQYHTVKKNGPDDMIVDAAIWANSAQRLCADSWFKPMLGTLVVCSCVEWLAFLHAT